MKEAINKLLYKRYYPGLEKELFGLSFPTPAGTLPGLDQNGEKYNRFPWHYSFVEIGPLSPSAQVQDTSRSLINRLLRPESLIPNKGVKNAILHIKDNPPHSLIAANIIADKAHINTETVARDFLTAFTRLYDFADMFIIDTFRKNADNLIMLQDIDVLKETIDPLLEMRFCYETSKPILFRVVPSIPKADLEDMLHYMMMSGIDGIVAGYDTYCPEFVKTINGLTKGRLPIIACGGIDTPQKAKEMLECGASLIQTGAKIKQILKFIQE